MFQVSTMFQEFLSNREERPCKFNEKLTFYTSQSLILIKFQIIFLHLFNIQYFLVFN